MPITKTEYWYDDDYRAWLSALPCLKCIEEFDIELAPIYQNDPAHDRLGTGGGTSKKPSDSHCSPLCRDHHNEQHSTGAVTFWGSNLELMKRTNLALRRVYDPSDYMPAILVLQEYRDALE